MYYLGVKVGVRPSTALICEKPRIPVQSVAEARKWALQNPDALLIEYCHKGYPYWPTRMITSDQGRTTIWPVSALLPGALVKIWRCWYEPTTLHQGQILALRTDGYQIRYQGKYGPLTVALRPEYVLPVSACEVIDESAA